MAQAPESPSGAVLNERTIVDSNGYRWTLVNAGGTTGWQVARNEIVDTSTSNAALLLYWNKAVYYKKTTGEWYLWSGSAWVLTTDPRTGPSAESPDGTTVPPS